MAEQPEILSSDQTRQCVHSTPQEAPSSASSTKRAVAMFSGGLDSSLAIRIMQLQGFEVHAIFVETLFERCHEGVHRAAKALGVPLTVIPPQDEYIEVIKRPRFGYGQGANPCIDCRLYMCRFAKQLMEEIGAAVVVTGEVVGQRPMSQHRWQQHLVEKHSGLKGRLLRPLSAKLLPPTIPEIDGLVDRERLYAFSGRSRKPLIELAHQLGITIIPQPSIGCLLTQPSFAPRVFDLLKHRPEATRWEFEILQVGRHIRLSPQTKVVIGRNAEDNAFLAATYRNYRPPDCVFLHPENFMGPDAMLTGQIEEEHIQLAARLIIRYTNARKLPEQPLVRISHQEREEVRTVTPSTKPVQLVTL
ncbi:MAG: hypothetical protein NZ899_08840 [Thermoguttaceae bacterium]|nr:hypothetical protein [Thermoguttaceae bacterium]MDW8077949.1 hypothetical protein [Thermoguttaceae bacterium]